MNYMNSIFPVHILYRSRNTSCLWLNNQPHGEAYNTPTFTANPLGVQTAKIPRNLRKARRNSSICIWWLQQCRSPHTRSCCFVSSFLVSLIATFPCRHLNFSTIQLYPARPPNTVLSQNFFLNFYTVTEIPDSYYFSHNWQKFWYTPVHL